MKLEIFVRKLLEEGITVAFIPPSRPEQYVMDITCTYVAPTKQQYAVKKALFPNECMDRLRFREALDLIFKTAMTLKDPKAQKRIMDKMPKKNPADWGVLLKSSIKELNLGSIIENQLLKAGYQTIGGLTNTLESELRNLKGLIELDFVCIKTALSDRGLKLKG